MRYSIESWDPAYGGGADPDERDPATGPVDAEAEVAATRWAPVRPRATSGPASVGFVDGVRRIDARLWIHRGEGSVGAGLCASVAAGLVRSTAGGAELVAVAVRRGVVGRPGEVGPIDTPWGPYVAVPTAGDDDAAGYLAVHQLMTSLEVEVTAQGAGTVELVVVDGPLRGRGPLVGQDGAQIPVVGYVKTHHRSYLPPELDAVQSELAAGERTPVFWVGGGFPRWSWYLRLPGPRSHPRAGVVRCELVGRAAVTEAVVLADEVTALLQRHASVPHKDPRAPQNLQVIAGLERTLRRRPGDAAILERHLRQQAATTAV